MRAEVFRARRHNDGFALVAVLAVTALLSGLLLSLSLWSRNSVENAAVAASDLQAKALLRSAAAVAVYQLFVLKLPRERVDNQEIALDGGVATISLSDDSGKVDLNRSEAPLLAAAYRAAGLSRMTPEIFAARVVDWRDDDDAPSEGGAEAPTYRDAGLPPPRNGDFRTISDLRWVLGVDQADVAALTPFITVFNPAGHLNPYSTPSSLVGVLPSMTAASASIITTLAKAPRSEQNLADMHKVLEGHEFLVVDAITLFRLHMDANTTDGQHQQGIELIAGLSVDKLKPAKIISLRR